MQYFSQLIQLLIALFTGGSTTVELPVPKAKETESFKNPFNGKQATLTEELVTDEKSGNAFVRVTLAQ